MPAQPVEAYLNAFGANTVQPAVVINGGVLNQAGSSNVHLGPVTMTGGTMSGAEYYTYTSASTITTNASPATALISAGTLALHNNTTFTVAADNSGAPDLIVSSQIVQDPATTTMGITKAGPGWMLISGSNSYGGGTTLNGGILQLGSNLALGAGTGALTVGGSGTLDLNGFNPTVGAVNGARNHQQHFRRRIAFVDRRQRRRGGGVLGNDPEHLGLVVPRQGRIGSSIA